MAHTSSARPLAGVRVLDFSRVVSGPFASQLLADLGAEVIRIQALPAGQAHADAGPGALTEAEAFTWGIGRNKHSVCVDLKNPRGRELVERLVSVSDIVFDNFRPGVMRRLGLDREALVRHNPSIITCSLTGFGESGPWSTMPAYDPIVQAMSGAMNYTRLDGAGAPVRWGIPIGDLFAGLFCGIGIVAAVLHRDRCGAGQHVDVSMLDVMLALNTYRVPQALSMGEEPEPSPFEGGQGTVPFGNFECRDGWLAICISQRAWSAACDILGRPDLATDERFRTQLARHAHRDELVSILRSVFLEHSADELQARFMEAGVVGGKVLRVAEVFSHPQVVARGMAVEIGDDHGRSAIVAGDPLKFSDSEHWRAPSREGSDTRAVLSALLGTTDAELDELCAAGVVHAARTADGRFAESSYATQPRAGSAPPAQPRGELGRSLDGTVVLELNGDEPSKGFAAQLLADLGATVIRVDRPASRHLEPYPDSTREAAFRHGLNRGKSSVFADLKTEPGLEFFGRLVREADVVLDNYRPGVLDRLGIGEESLRELNPRTIACSITGFGHSGPWSRYPAFDNAIQALGGGMSVTVDHTRPEVPVRWGNPIGGLTGSLYATLGTLAALRLRDRTGEARRLDVSLLDAQVALLAYRVPQAVTLGKAFLPEPRRGGSGSLPFGVFKCADDRWFTMCITPQFWGRFCEIAGVPHWRDDPRFVTEPLRRENETALNALLDEQLLTKEAGEWERLFFEHKLPGAVVVDLTSAFGHDQAQHRGMCMKLPDAEHSGGVQVAGFPIKFSAAAPVPAHPAPRHGADTDRMSREVGFGAKTFS
ncbi:CaiB/BaiF CoA transferase family protein [Prauserella cavernicola]|uniref:CoA transferase n=1 Tax=Prauserella cavernicola TaxID=2800127 RepID=A0A934QV36_9PSEU|nr:CoA transferase [Prauserella cavernicola]MBK1787116.1 CoA transferase [Prauserella cavernicola]